VTAVLVGYVTVIITRYCDGHVGLSVRSLAYLANLGNHTAELQQIFVIFTMAVFRSSSGGVAIRRVLPVLWITSRFHIMYPMARHMYAYNSTTVLARPKVYRTLTSHIFRVERNNRHTAPMTGCARNRVLASFDFGPRQLNSDARLLPSFGRCNGRNHCIDYHNFICSYSTKCRESRQSTFAIRCFHL